MKLKAGLTVGCLLFTLFLTLPLVVAVTDFQVDSTDLQVYRDGLVRITQTLSVNETTPVVSFPLLASLVDNFVILDENQTVLDYEFEDGNLTVFSLGTTSVSVQYDTSSLTLKDSEVWTLVVDTPYNLTIVLPEDSTIVYLSGVPDSIDTNGNTISMSLFPDHWEINYVFPLTPPANFQVSNLKVSPTDAQAGEEVTIFVRITNVGLQTAPFTFSLIVDQTVEATRTVNLEPSESTTASFMVTRQTTGTYNVQIEGLEAQFTVSNTSSNGVPIEYLFGGVAIAAVIFVIMFYFLRRKGTSVENIFKLHPQLNTEEKGVIQFLAQNEGKAFESQIREKFPDIPRTSLWRLVKRLEKLEIIKVKKIGLENQVQLKK